MNKVKERPMLFSTPMVQAILDDRKTMTRRIYKLPKDCVWSDFEQGLIVWEENSCQYGIDEFRCPHGSVGDRLWLRETFSAVVNLGTDKNGDTAKDLFSYNYKADLTAPIGGYWKPSIHMPRAASRILLEITNVRVERLHDISVEDAIAEGIGFDVVDQAVFFNNYMSTSHFADDDFCNLDDKDAPIKSYLSLWESINGLDSLESNPWVWVVEFKVVEIKQ